MLVRFLQLANARSSIRVTLFGIVTLVSPPKISNAPRPIAVTGLPFIVPGISTDVTVVNGITVCPVIVMELPSSRYRSMPCMPSAAAEAVTLVSGRSSDRISSDRMSEIRQFLIFAS